MRDSTLSELADIRRIAVALVTGSPGEYGMCRGWTSVHQEAVISEGLGPWLYKSLGDPVQSGLDPNILSAMRQSYKFSAVSCLYREAALRKLLPAFNACGIPVILLKGFYLGSSVYVEPALRPMDDVDLLVREEDFDQAGHELERLGYRPMFHLSREEDRLLRLPIVYGTVSAVPEIIDLHRCIQSMDYYSFPADVVWEDAVEKELYGCQVFYLSTELNFIHLALHNLNHRGLLRDWVDLVTVLRNMNFDWDRLILLARSLGALRPLFWIFQELGDSWGTPPPASVSASLESYVPTRMEDRVIRHRFRYFWRLAARVARLNGWRARLRYFATRFVPPHDMTEGRISSCILHVKSKISLFQHLWRRS